MVAILSYLFDCFPFEFAGSVAAGWITVSEDVESAHRIKAQDNGAGIDW